MNLQKNMRQEEIRFAIDLTWVRHTIVGGTESFVNNLIAGFMQIPDEYSLVLIVAEDNASLFKKYIDDRRISLVVAPIKCANVKKRIIWQNLHLNKFLLTQNLKLCLEPVYAKPIFGNRNVKYVTVIHDLQALHLPEYNSLIQNVWLRISWFNTVHTSKHVICISDFVKKDVLNKYNIPKERITTIYNPIVMDVSNQIDFSQISKAYGVKEEEYYYTVSKLNRHKNLTTLVKVFGKIKRENISKLPCKLLVSGVNGGMAEDLMALAIENNVEEEIVLTGFVDDSVRNCLYTHAKAFLFPSIFEGFGMPPIEALCCGTPVITTNETCIPETTQHLALYVNNPYDLNQWIEMMINCCNQDISFDITKYNPAVIAKQYLQVLKNTKW